MAPATITAAETASAGPAAMWTRPSRTSSSPSASATPARTMGDQEAGMIPGPVANAASRVRAGLPGPSGATGFPFDHKTRLRRRARPGPAGTATWCTPCR